MMLPKSPASPPTRIMRHCSGARAISPPTKIYIKKEKKRSQEQLISLIRVSVHRKKPAFFSLNAPPPHRVGI